MQEVGYLDPKVEDNFLTARPNIEEEFVNKANRIGSVRVSWEIKEAGLITVMAM